MVAGNTRGGNVTNFVCSVEAATHHVAASPDMPRPRQDDVAERIVGPSPKTLQSAFFDQIIPELTKTESGVIVTEARSRYNGEPYIGVARRVAVAMLEAEIHYSANH